MSLNATRRLTVDATAPQSATIDLAADILRTGGLVAFPTETVYGLGANAFDRQAVDRIFEAKGRPPSDPIIVHIHEIEQLGLVTTDIPDLALELARKFWPGPLTLVLPRNPNIPANVSANMPTVAVRMPSHPVASALLKAANVPIAAPSANRFARPSATSAAHVLEDLDGRIEVVLDGGSASIGVESTILSLTKKCPTILRPGGVTLEALRTIIPNVEVISKQLRVHDEGIEAPGMLYKHYSPRAKLLLFDGHNTNLIPVLRKYAIDLLEDGKQVGLLLPQAELPHYADLPLITANLGQTLEDYSHNLFDAMRSLDQANVDVILVHAFGQSGLGLALWDRLLRAAEGNVITV